MRNKTRIVWITRTAVFIALLIVMQAATAALGNTLVTGSIVNMMLVISVMTCGLASGLTVAVISPVMAKLMGIGPFWSLIPFIIAGNAALAFIWHVVGDKSAARKHVAHIAALISAAVIKFIVLYIGVVMIAVPVFLKLPDKQAAAISNMFSVPQLITALIGGLLALLLFPRLKAFMGAKRERDGV